MTSFVAESIGMVGFITNVIGNVLVTRKNRNGWWVRIVSNLLWTVYAGSTASLSVNVNHGVFFLLNVYGWWRWSRDEKLEKSRKANEDRRDV